MSLDLSRRLGFGLGLRPAHFPEILGGAKGADWFEAISENYLGIGGRPLHNLLAVRADYPVALHGVSLSIGSADPLDRDYLGALRDLARRVEPVWISDHLCWTGSGGKNLHDLLPVPYDSAMLGHIAARIGQVQDFLGREILIENVSSYVAYAGSDMSEWDFLVALARRSGCRLLIDVNNIHVSAFNHDFDPWQYLAAIPVDLVWQIHLAGHENCGDYIIDTHDRPIIDEVWRLYAEAIRRFGPVASMIERDDAIPAFAELTAELAIARRVAADALMPGLAA